MHGARVNLEEDEEHISVLLPLREAAIAKVEKGHQTTQRNNFGGTLKWLGKT